VRRVDLGTSVGRSPCHQRLKGVTPTSTCLRATLIPCLTLRTSRLACPGRCSSAPEFVVANVLVYAFDSSAKAKQAAARELIERLWESGTGCLSVQVLQEFFVTVTRKVAQPLSVDEAADRIREFTTWKVFAPTADDVLAAIALHKQAKVSFWDAMVVQAAAESGCDTLWTEDLNDGQVLRGVRIRDPFAADQSAKRGQQPKLP
jgi:predicted nucleic acid-binding protein